MKHKQGDVVRIKSADHHTAIGKIPTMMLPYVGNEAVVEHVDKERGFYQIRLIVPWMRGIIRFNATERMVEPEINEEMLKAATNLDCGPDIGENFAKLVYQAMRAARFKTVVTAAGLKESPEPEKAT